MITKAVSFLLLSFAIVVLAFEFGLAKFFIELLLPERYYQAIGMFQLLMLASLAIPFILLSSIINAAGKPEKVLVFVLISFAVSLGIFYFVAQSQNSLLIPLLLLSYYFSVGIFNYYYIKRNYGFPLLMIFRSIPDSYRFLKSRFLKTP